MCNVLRRAWDVSVQCVLVSISDGTWQRCPAWGARSLHPTLSLSPCFSEQFFWSLCSLRNQLHYFHPREGAYSYCLSTSGFTKRTAVPISTRSQEGNLWGSGRKTVWILLCRTGVKVLLLFHCYENILFNWKKKCQVFLQNQISSFT